MLLPLPFYYTANFCLIRSISVFLLALRPLSDFNTARETRSCSGAYTGISFLFVIASSIFLLGCVRSFIPPDYYNIYPRRRDLPVGIDRIPLVRFLLFVQRCQHHIFRIFYRIIQRRVSAILSFCRTFVFTAACLLVLPHFLGINGAWIAVPAAEVLTLLISLYMHQKYFMRPGKQNYFAEISKKKSRARRCDFFCLL